MNNSHTEEKLLSSAESLLASLGNNKSIKELEERLKEEQRKSDDQNEEMRRLQEKLGEL